MNILFHVDGVERWNAAVSGVRNLLDHYEENRTSVQIEVVACGEAVRALMRSEAEKRSGLAEGLRYIAGEGVVLAACGSSLYKYRIPTETLLHEVTIVPVGMAELVERQSLGYAYIKI